MLKITLRPHQVSAVVGLNKSLKANRTHLLYAPTGAGKTAIAAHMINDFIEQDKRVIFTAPYTSLIEQTWLKFREYGLPDAGIIWQKHPQTNFSKKIQIASIDTLINREWPEFDVMIVDEAHIRRRKQLEFIAETDKTIIGMTATPFCDWLGTYYESMIKASSTQELIQKKMLSDFVVYQGSKPNREGLKTTQSESYGADFEQTEAANRMRSLVGDIPAMWLEYGDNRPTIAFCMNVLHANDVANQLSKHDVRCEVITAKTPMEHRPDMFKRFRQGTTKILVSVGCLIAGFDEDVRCIICAQMTKSLIRHVQMLGRGLRIADGKDHCVILDHAGNIEDLGCPDQVYIDALIGTSDGLESVKALSEEIKKKDRQPKKCPQCPAIKKADEYECPNCGFTPRYGEDSDTNREINLVLLERAKKIAEDKEKQQFYSELVAYFNAETMKGKSWKPGWPAMKYKEKYQEWPPNHLRRVPLPCSAGTANWIKSRQIAWAKSRRRG